MPHFLRRTLLTLVVAGCLAACGGSEPLPGPPAKKPPSKEAEQLANYTGTTIPAPKEPSVKVVGIDIGSAIGPDKSITTKATTFAPMDTVHVVVRTEGTAEFVNFQARWHDPANSVILIANQSAKTTGPTATEFHYSTLQGLAPGTWTVEILVDSIQVGSTTFEVK